MKLMEKMFGEYGWINQRLTGKDNSYLHRKTTVGEGLQYIGYMIAIANNPGRPVKSMWAEKTPAGVKQVLPPPNVGRFGMSQHRFNHLTSLIPHTYSVEEHDLDKSDPWRNIRVFVDGFNEHWAGVYHPSWLLSPDEMMSMWTPEEGDGWNDIAFMSYVPRKPKPKGCEFKTVCDGESGMLIRVELALNYKRKRGEPAVTPPFSEEWGLTAAQCLRLCEPWHHTNRVFGADAHFISVDSVEALREHGIYGFGDLKKLTSRFPVKELEEFCGIESGDWNVMTSTIGSKDWPVFGVAHRRGGAVHTFISTHGTTKRGKDQRHKDDVDIDGSIAPPRKCPKVLNDWTKCQPHTDKHNRWRQSILAIEERFRTTSFPFRVFTTLIVGCTAVSTYTGHSYHVKNDMDNDDDDFREVMEQLAVELMLNRWDDDHSTDPRQPSAQKTYSSVGNHPQSETSCSSDAHVPIPISQAKALTNFAGASPQRCSVCRTRLTAYCCGSPSCLSDKSVVPICLPQTKSKGRIILHSCLAKHRQAPEDSHTVCASFGRQKASSRGCRKKRARER